MNHQKKSILLPSLICLGLLLTFSPVFLSDNYLRQDDLMWEIWPGMKMSDFGFIYNNIVFQSLRPLCMISYYITDLISIDITNAVYIRLMSVIILCVLSVLSYRWQLSYNSNKILAATYATASFSLPAYQVFAATGNYSLILTALLMTFGAAFSWRHAFYEENAEKKKWYYRIGCGLFFASLLDYPLSSMYIWVLMTICLLNLSNSPKETRKFIFHISYTTLKMMFYYYVVSRLVHLVFHVDTNYRSNVLDTSNIGTKFHHFFNILGWHSNFWFWDSTTSPYQTPCLLLILSLFFLTLNKANKNIKTAAFLFITTLLFLFLSYSPILAGSEINITYRYTITTMPILLYTVFWSINHLTSKNKAVKISGSALLACITLSGLTYANIMLADGIVGPHTKEFLNTQNVLTEKALPLLKENKKILIHAIACDQKNEPVRLEYSMRTCQYQQQVISVIVHSLRKMGYASNFNSKNTVIYNENEIIVKDTPWGTLVVNNKTNSPQDLSKYTNNTYPIITIDTRTLPQYEQHDFYHQLMSKLRNIIV